MVSDLILLHQGKKYRCHQIVFKNSSEYFQNILRKNEELELKLQKGYLERQRLELPDFLSPSSLKLFIKFLYLGAINDRSLDYKEIFDFYRTAAFFKHSILED